MTILATSCHIFSGNRVLLLRKREGLFGGGKWDPPGGKMEPGESPEACVEREVSEETGLKIRDPSSRGVLQYYKYDQREKPDWTVYLFIAEKFHGVPVDSREGTLRWFGIGELPLGEMWEDYQYWYRHLLDGRKLEGRFYFSGDFEKLRDHWLRVL